ncbi:MAG: FAD-dependent oxidoreductase [Sphaerochaeta sp.]|jgi:prolycopene isomerase|uniref:FAD-dependent oxidoreductase n=1 Tax=Sphaerochaeta sp. TaxID=1972642 RepID=UPI002FCA4D8B
MKDFDVLVIGAGLSGLSSAALLAKRSVKVALVDKASCPGGSCGAFKREDAFFDQGSSMLFGWGLKGFNAHRFLFNCLEQEIDIIEHEQLYAVRYQGKTIRFLRDIQAFIEELMQLFPDQREQLKRFYQDMERLYTHVMIEHPSYTTADEVDRKAALKALLHHPLSYIRFLSMLNHSAKELLDGYFTNPAIFDFFDKLTSTYSYTTVAESPAILSSVMFVDNHIGGSYYPAGSSLMLPGKLEKVVEENGGTMIAGAEVVSILFADGKPNGVLLSDGRKLFSDQLIYSGTVWNLYGKLIDPAWSTEARRSWAAGQVPTYPSVVLYALVDAKAIDEKALPVEMLVGNPSAIDEQEVTVYIPSLDDHTLCEPGREVVIAIGPSFVDWTNLDEEAYQKQKQAEAQRMLSYLATRFTSITEHVVYQELASPRTIERYTMKNNGAVAGPKQMLGQHMFKRLHIRTEWDTLFCCGESTIMGTGTPTVTTSGIAAANAVLKARGLETFTYDPKRAEYVHLFSPPYTYEQLYRDSEGERKTVQQAARQCLLCEHPACCAGTDWDVPAIMRRVMVGNWVGAQRLVRIPTVQTYQEMEAHCIGKTPVSIGRICRYLSACERALHSPQSL